jgi:hypothetical protein
MGSPYKIVMWLDPGQTTGCALWVSEETRAARQARGASELEDIYTMQVVNCHTREGLDVLRRQLIGWMDSAVPFRSSRNVLLGCESFDFRRDERFRDKIDYTPAQVIGAVRAWDLEWSWVDITLQGAGQGKGFWTDDKLKRAGVYKPGQKHAMDALRHMLTHLTFHCQDQTWLRRLKG